MNLDPPFPECLLSSFSGVYISLPFSCADLIFPKRTFQSHISLLSVPFIRHLNCHLLHLKAMFPRKAECMSWVSSCVQTFLEAQGKKHTYLPSNLKGQLKCQLASGTKLQLCLLTWGHQVLTPTGSLGHSSMIH